LLVIARRRIEPQRPSTGLTCVPNGHDLLRINDGLALGVGVLALMFAVRRFIVTSTHRLHS
jgi:hypothetical protein